LGQYQCTWDPFDAWWLLVENYSNPRNRPSVAISISETRKGTTTKQTNIAGCANFSVCRQLRWLRCLREAIAENGVVTGSFVQIWTPRLYASSEVSSCRTNLSPFTKDFRGDSSFMRLKNLCKAQASLFQEYNLTKCWWPPPPLWNPDRNSFENEAFSTKNQQPLKSIEPFERILRATYKFTCFLDLRNASKRFRLFSRDLRLFRFFSPWSVCFSSLASPRNLPSWVKYYGKFESFGKEFRLTEFIAVERVMYDSIGVVITWVRDQWCG